MQNLSLQAALLLHSRAYRDNSLLLEFFCQQQGRVAMLAKGVKQSKRIARGLLQPFIPLLISARGRGELLTLTAVEADGIPYRLSGKLLYSGLYLNELLLRLLIRHDPHPMLFAYYQQALSDLAAATPVMDTLRQFEIRLLQELGYGLQLQLCVDTDAPIQAEVEYYYQPDTGLISQPATDTIRVSGACLIALANNQFDNDRVRQQARHFMRLVLQHYLGNRPLKSRELFA